MCNRALRVGMAGSYETPLVKPRGRPYSCHDADIPMHPIFPPGRDKPDRPLSRIRRGTRRNHRTEGVRLMRPILSRLPRRITRWSKLLGMSAAVGALSGLAAAALEWGLHTGSAHLIGRFTDLGEAGVMHVRWGLVVLPALGGLAAGLVLHLLCPEAQGHGTDLLIRAFHRRGGILPLRGPSVHAVGAVGVISCGGSAGPEGPIAALGAAIGSSLARRLGVTPRERRIMLVAGCGAGIGAIFQCPLGGALFASSVLYRESDFETDAMVPSFVASVVGYSAYMPFWGYGHHLLRDADRLVFTSPLELIPFLLLGPLCGLTCFIFRAALRTTEFVSRRVPLPPWMVPALGGLGTGLLACFLPQVMDGQYVFIQHAMDGTFRQGFGQHSWLGWAALFGLVAVAKCLATGFTIGSGAPGGVLGPSVFLGGALGALAGAVLTAWAPEAFTADPENLRRALIPVGMAGVLSASMRVPLASLVMVTEMTGSYGLIVPLMVVCITSYLIGRRWGLNDEQVPTSAESPAHAGDLLVHVLESATVEELMHRHWPDVVSPQTPLRELVRRLHPGSRPAVAVVEHGRVEGLISVEEIRSVLDTEGLGEALIAADMMNPAVPRVRPDETLYEALHTMQRSRQAVLPVVATGDGERFVGMILRSDIHRLLRRRIDEMSRHLLEEHAGLAAVEYEETIHQLAVGVAAGKTDRIQRLIVPLQVVGMSLREADFRRRFGVQVIAIEKPDGSIQCPPDVDAPLQTNQRLLAIVATGNESTQESTQNGSDSHYK
ncbi:MAG: CBS domain-containing protein [Planctomycetota bacterium]|nr:MAG: CBS domain-containing protein [Planctomycetota bacterium]